HHALPSSGAGVAGAKPAPQERGPPVRLARRHRTLRLAAPTALRALARARLLGATRLGRRPGLLALVPGVAILAARRQAGVLGQQLAAPPGRRGVLAPPIAGRLVSGDELVLGGADQVAAPHAQQRLAQQRPALGVVPAQERLVQAPLLLALDHHHALALVGDLAQRVLAGVVHGGGRGHRRGVEGLHL